VAEKIVRLTYPAHLLDVPVINQLIREFDLTVNILRAQVSPQEGWVNLHLTGNTSAIVQAIDWLTEKNIEVELLNESQLP
jgi:L-aspartate semialdehyde sulfurtransferase ferredoxin